MTRQGSDDNGAQTVDQIVPVGEVEARLQDWLDDYAPAPTSPEDPTWQLAITPPLPLEWPPTDGTRWVRWVYARSIEPGLMDAERVSYPWASVALTADHDDEAVLRLVTPQITAHPDPQGVRPLDADEIAALEGLQEAGVSAVELTGEPDEPAATLIRGAYAAWLATNGVIASTLPDAHDAFWEFVGRGA